MRRVDLLEKTDAGRDWGQEEKGTTKDEMAGWHHWLDGRESGWTPGVGDGQGGLACCDSWSRKESDMTERLIWSDLIWKVTRPSKATIINIQHKQEGLLAVSTFQALFWALYLLGDWLQSSFYNQRSRDRQSNLLAFTQLLGVDLVLEHSRSVAKSCQTLCDPMDRSMPGYSIFNTQYSKLKHESRDPLTVTKGGDVPRYV